MDTPSPGTTNTDTPSQEATTRKTAPQEDGSPTGEAKSNGAYRPDTKPKDAPQKGENSPAAPQEGDSPQRGEKTMLDRASRSDNKNQEAVAPKDDKRDSAPQEGYCPKRGANQENEGAYSLNLPKTKGAKAPKDNAPQEADSPKREVFPGRSIEQGESVPKESGKGNAPQNSNPSAKEQQKQSNLTKDPTPTRGLAWGKTVEKQLSPQEYKDLYLTKYRQYIEGAEIKPVPGAWEAIEDRVLSLIISDMPENRLLGMKKEDMAGLLHKLNIPVLYLYQRSYAMWDILLPTKEDAERLSLQEIKYGRTKLKPEYQGRTRTRVQVFNVPMQISAEILGSFFTQFGEVEKITPVRSKTGMHLGSYTVAMRLKKEGFQAIPAQLTFKEATMTVVVEGRRPHCWFCQKQGHMAKSCPQRLTPTRVTLKAVQTSETAPVSKIGRAHV